MTDYESTNLNMTKNHRYLGHLLPLRGIIRIRIKINIFLETRNIDDV